MNFTGREPLCNHVQIQKWNSAHCKSRPSFYIPETTHFQLHDSNYYLAFYHYGLVLSGLRLL